MIRRHHTTLTMHPTQYFRKPPQAIIDFRIKQFRRTWDELLASGAS